MTFRPMLSATLIDERLPELRFPKLASPKLDGIRATILRGKLISRSGKLIPNAYIRSCLEDNAEWEGLDGELIVGSPTAPDCFRTTTSGVMSQDGTPDFKFYVFDIVALAMFDARLDYATELASKNSKFLTAVPHQPIYTVEELMRVEEKYLLEGYEGVMLRNPNGVYKQGRSTMGDQGLIKLKRFYDSEAEVIGVEERMHNGNEATIDALGYTERSSHKENLTGRGDLGALIVRDTKTNMEFRIGTGFDDALRAEMWKVPPIGKIVKYKFFPSGSKDKPRFPVYIGFRNKEDM